MKKLLVLTLLIPLLTGCDYPTEVVIHDDYWVMNNDVVAIGKGYRLDSVDRVYDEENDKYTVTIEFEKRPEWMD